MISCQGDTLSGACGGAGELGCFVDPGSGQVWLTTTIASADLCDGSLRARVLSAKTCP